MTISRNGSRPTAKAPPERFTGSVRGEMGQAWCPSQRDQPRNHHHAARQGRADRAARRRLPADDRSGPAGRAGTPDEVGNVGALLMGSDGAFITGSDFLMDGGVTASYWFGELAPKEVPVN